MSANEYIQQFSPHLFWDVRKEDIDFDVHAQYVIKRVLEYGLLNDWNLILWFTSNCRNRKGIKMFGTPCIGIYCCDFENS